MSKCRFSSVRFCAIALLVGLPVVGCESKEAKPAGGKVTTATPPASLPGGFFLAAAPADAKTVEEVKKTAKAGDTVALRGRVGGSKEPFVAGRAVLTLMGPGLAACSDDPGDKCPTPWDYCCENKKDIGEHAATVQVTDASGAPLKADLKGQGGIKELSDLIVVGKVSMADGNVLIVNATGVFVAKP